MRGAATCGPVFFCKLLSLFAECCMRAGARTSWILEWSKSSPMWRLPCVREFLQQHLHTSVYPALAFQDQLSEPSGTFRRLVSSNKSLTSFLPRRCSELHRHDPRAHFNPLACSNFVRASLAAISALAPPPALPACCCLPLSPGAPPIMQWHPSGTPAALPLPPSTPSSSSRALPIEWTSEQLHGLAAPPCIPPCFPPKPRSRHASGPCSCSCFAEHWSTDMVRRRSRYCGARPRWPTSCSAQPGRLEIATFLRLGNSWSRYAHPPLLDQSMTSRYRLSGLTIRRPPLARSLCPTVA